MLVIEILCFLVVVLLSMWIIQPRLRAQYVDIASATHAEAASKLNATMESLISFSHYMVSSPQLQEQVKALEEEHSDDKEAEMRLTMNHLASTLSNITGVYLDFYDGEIINSFADTRMLEGYFSGGAYAQIIAVPHSQGFELMERENGQYLVFSKNCYIGTSNCTLTMVYDSSYLFNEISRLCAPLFSEINLTDASGKVIYRGTSEDAFSGAKGITFTADRIS